MEVGNYLLRRLKAYGVHHLFGVPGDYNLPFMDQVMTSEVAWVGNCNELNAAYAADGYARINGIAAFAVTYGVGELSAMNGIGGAYCEYVPVVVLGSMPARATMESRTAVVHHSLGDGDWFHYLRALREVTVAQAVITPENAVADIERVLQECVSQRRPVYLGIPVDVAWASLPWVPDADLAPELPEIASDPQALQAFSAAASELIASARNPVLLAGPGVHRFGYGAELQELAVRTELPLAVTMMARGVVDEARTNWAGVYLGASSAEPIRELVDHSDCLIRVGTPLSDLETTGFSQQFDESKSIEIRLDYCRVAGIRFQHIRPRDALAELASLLPHGTPVSTAARPPAPPRSGPLTQAMLWDQIAATLRPGDTLVVDTGTSTYSMIDYCLPSDVQYVSMGVWASIGYSTPAALGAARAAPERRTIVLVGDGAFQLTVQEISTIAAQRLPVVLVVVANDGYTIERAVHPEGRQAPYNTIARWDHVGLTKALCGPDTPASSVATAEELAAELTRINAGTSGLQVLEVCTAPLDFPPALAALGAAGRVG